MICGETTQLDNITENSLQQQSELKIEPEESQSVLKESEKSEESVKVDVAAFIVQKVQHLNNLEQQM